jgi:protein-disulfide isomerase
MGSQESSKFLVPLAIVVAGALVAGAVYFGSSGNSPQTVTGSAANAKLNVAKVTEEDHILGSRNAELIIVEYSDTECPFCKIFHETMKQVLSDYGTQVAWVYRHFPIVQLHAKAPKEAEATECAAEQGGNQAFWNYLDEIFERTNSNDSLPTEELPRIAGDIGLDIVAFNECLTSSRYTEAIKESVAAAVKAGARGTPYSVILDGDSKVVETINGAEPLQSVKLKLDAILK